MRLMGRYLTTKRNLEFARNAIENDLWFREQWLAMRKKAA